jgi:hypothetical protein
MTTRILVDRRNLASTRIETAAETPLAEGEVRVKTGRFALTANNVTYGLAGDLVGYWNFFPAPLPEGVIPVWGFATVSESRAPALPVGTGLWGFLPFASDVVMRPVGVTPHGFVDGADHRAMLPGLYNHYALTAADSADLAAAGDARSLYFPLFTTGFVLADWLADQAFLGASQVLVASASSKTGYGLAFNLAGAGVRRIGLTAPANLAFTRALGAYDEVLAYADLSGLDPSVASVFVDMAGNPRTTAAVHQHFGSQLKASVAVGLTHQQGGQPTTGLPGPQPAFFFAPTQIEKRDQDWGPGELRRRADAANLAIVRRLEGQVAVETLAGAEALCAGWTALARGELPPARSLLGQF